MVGDQEPCCTERGLRDFVAHAGETWIPVPHTPTPEDSA